MLPEIVKAEREFREQIKREPDNTDARGLEEGGGEVTTNPLNTLLDDADFTTFGREFERMLALATERGLVLYAILNRNAGVGIQWYDAVLQASKSPARGYTTNQDGIVIYAYHDTLQGAIRAEIKRMAATP